jgi:preprotein translocase subunit YajC
MVLALGLMILFFFIVILPAQRKQKREAEAISSTLKKNDEVITTSGIIGVVHMIKDEEVVLKIDDNARIRVLKSTIARIVKKDDAKDAAAPAPAADTNIKPNA